MWTLLAVAASLVVAAAPPAGAQEPPPTGCSWSVKLNGRHGLAGGWPDNNATYWYASYAAVPGTRVVLEGQYPHARFFTIDVYDAKANPYIPPFVDRDLVPDPGSVNPFATPSARGEQSYTAYIAFDDPPAEDREPNTIYAGTMVDGQTPNPGGLITLRIYLPDDQPSPRPSEGADGLTETPDPLVDQGGVPLPTMSLELPDGRRVPMRPCPVPESLPTQPYLREAVSQLGWPDPAPTAVPFPPASDPAQWSAQTNPDVDYLVDGLPGGSAAPDTGFGLLTTPFNSYLATRISREHGEVFVFRAEAPTFPDTRKGQWPGLPRQLRYWSVCTFSTASGQTAACLADDEIALDGAGEYTIVISSPAHRPRNADNWLARGGAYEGWISYRQFLASPRFDEAIENLAPDGDPAQAMGRYFPRSGYCSTAAFESGGADACLAGSATVTARAAAVSAASADEPTASLPATGSSSWRLLVSVVALAVVTVPRKVRCGARS